MRKLSLATTVGDLGLSGGRPARGRPASRVWLAGIAALLAGCSAPPVITVPPAQSDAEPTDGEPPRVDGGEGDAGAR